MSAARLTTAVPVLASLDIPASARFYEEKMGFKMIHVEAGSWGIVQRDAIQIHFWHCNDRRMAEHTSCRVQVENINALFDELEPHGILHPNGPLRDTAWGSREFDVLDLHGNLMTFFEWRDA